MVKFENDDGRLVFLKPEAVAAIGPSGIEGYSSVNAGTFYCIKGTPDEVHAKLFPKASGFGFTDTEKNEAMLEVLRWAGEAKGPWKDRLRVLARTALGWPLD